MSFKNGIEQNFTSNFYFILLSVINTLSGDVDGSVEAILDVVETYDEQERCKMSLVHYGVGNISDNDIELAAMFDGELNSFAMI
jgi:translation initiation factor IF-2